MTRPRIVRASFHHHHNHHQHDDEMMPCIFYPKNRMHCTMDTVMNALDNKSMDTVINALDNG